MLDVGSWEAYLAERGGQPIERLPYASLRCARVLSDTSDASVTAITGELTSIEGHALSDTRDWIHELDLRRNGEESWSGPLLEPLYTDEVTTVRARDLIQWLDRKVIPGTIRYTQQDLAVVMRSLVDQTLARDPSISMSTWDDDSGVVGNKHYDGDEYPYCGDLVRELSREGVDFTMIGRKMLIFGNQAPPPGVRDPLKLADHDLDSVQIAPRGLAQASRVIVVGGSAAGVAGNPRVVGIWGNQDEGFIEQVYRDESIIDASTAANVAEQRWRVTSRLPVEVTAVLHPWASVEFDQLVPGTIFEIDCSAGVRAVEGLFRLTRVDVTVNVAEQGEGEVVKVSLSPVGVASG